MIKKVKGGYKAITVKGRPLSKKPLTKATATKQHGAYHSAMKGKKK